MVKTEWLATKFTKLYPQFVYGYDRIEEAFEKCSVHDKIPLLSTPTLVIKSDCDPIVGEKGIKDEIVLQNKHMVLAKTQLGGHLGYHETLFGNK